MNLVSALFTGTGQSWNSVRVLLLAAALLALPQVFGQGYYLNTLNFVAVLALPAIGLSLLSGMCGQLAISHGAFFAIGAYGSAILNVRLALDPLLATVLTQAIVVVVSAAIGWVVLRLRSHYLAIATLSFSIIVEVLIKEWPRLTGGQQGMTGIPPYQLGPLQLGSDAAVYYVYWPVTLLMFWFALNLAQSRIGRVLRAIREGEPVVDSLGISVARHKAMIYIVSENPNERSCTHSLTRYYAMGQDLQDARDIQRYMPFGDARTVVCYFMPNSLGNMDKVKARYPEAEVTPFKNNLGHHLFTRVVIEAPHG